MSKALTTMGIDPGYDRLGIGIINNESINNPKYIYSTCIQSDKKNSYLDRILYINNELEQIIIKYKQILNDFGDENIAWYHNDTNFERNLNNVKLHHAIDIPTVKFWRKMAREIIRLITMKERY